MRVKPTPHAAAGVILLAAAAWMHFLPASDWNQNVIQASLCLVALTFLLRGFMGWVVMRVGFLVYFNLRIALLVIYAAGYWLYIFWRARELGNPLGTFFLLGLVLTGITANSVRTLLQLRRRHVRLSEEAKDYKSDADK